MYRIVVHKDVVRFLKTLSFAEQKAIRLKINLLGTDPFQNPNLDIKKIKGFTHLFRLRTGKIRIIYEVNKNELIILIISAGYRGNIYQKL